METNPMKKLAKLSRVLALAAPLFGLPRSVTASEGLPKPVADMECLVGQWAGPGTVVSGKDTAKINATWSCKRTSAQYGVLCAFHVTGIPGLAAYDETDLMGYEPNSNTYHWYSVTNAGETHDNVARTPARQSRVACRRRCAARALRRSRRLLGAARPRPTDRHSAR
jgi:hypothetical protein